MNYTQECQANLTPQTWDRETPPKKWVQIWEVVDTETTIGKIVYSLAFGVTFPETETMVQVLIKHTRPFTILPSPLPFPHTSPNSPHSMFHPRPRPPQSSLLSPHLHVRLFVELKMSEEDV
jgi:hypothetical protein